MAFPLPALIRIMRIYGRGFAGLSRRTGIILLVFGSLAVGVIFLKSKPIPSVPVHPPVPPLASSADAAFQGVHLIEAKGGRTLWEVKADRVELFEEGGLVRAKGVKEPVSATFYAENGRVIANADEALLNMRTKDVTLKGKVRAVSEKGATLETESLSWLAQGRRLVAHQEVVLTRGDFMSRAQGLEAEMALERVKLFGGVESEVRLHRFPEDRAALLAGPRDQAQGDLVSPARRVKGRAR